MTANDIAASLKSRFRSLKAQHTDLLQTADTIMEEMKRLRAAFHALTGEQADKSERTEEHTRPPGDTDGEPRSTLSPNEIEKTVRELLSQEALTDDELRRRLVDHARSQNRSAQGQHWTIRRLLRSRDFEQTDGRWHVRQSGELTRPS